MAVTSHPLKGKWFIFYQKAGKEENELMEGDYVTTIEEVFSVLKALPDVTILPPNESITFSRDKVDPKFESFPQGHRVTLYVRSKVQLDAVIPRVMAAVLGEAMFLDPEFEQPVPQAGVIRLTHKPHRVYAESSSIDVWFPDNPQMAKVEHFFKELLKSVSGMTIHMRPMEV